MRSVLHVVRRSIRSKTVLRIDGSSCLACSGRCRRGIGRRTLCAICALGKGSRVLFVLELRKMSSNDDV